jgi:hypothetical protein
MLFPSALMEDVIDRFELHFDVFDVGHCKKRSLGKSPSPSAQVRQGRKRGRGKQQKITERIIAADRRDHTYQSQDTEGEICELCGQPTAICGHDLWLWATHIRDCLWCDCCWSDYDDGWEAPRRREQPVFDDATDKHPDPVVLYGNWKVDQLRLQKEALLAKRKSFVEYMAAVETRCYADPGYKLRFEAGQTRVLPCLAALDQDALSGILLKLDPRQLRSLSQTCVDLRIAVQSFEASIQAEQRRAAKFAGTGLLSLPEELLAIICVRMGEKEQNALASTCRFLFRFVHRSIDWKWLCMRADLHSTSPTHTWRKVFNRGSTSASFVY